MAFSKKTVRDVEIAGKTVLVRVDYNVPMEAGKVVDDLRIRASLPTLRYLIKQKAKKVILISHLGRPEGKVVPAFSLRAVSERLATLLPKQTVQFSPELTGERAFRAVDSLPDGGVLLLENLRFDPREEANGPALALQIVQATRADLFVQDGFAVLHRAHASTDALAKQLPAVAGLLVEKEVTALTEAVEAPARPLLVIIGGAKVADKQPLIDRFLKIADYIAVGGKIAVDGYRATDKKVYVAEDFSADETGAKLDIGVKSATHIARLIMLARTIVWNGTLGKVEDPQFARASRGIALALGRVQGKKVIIGGGDTAGFVNGLLADDPKLHYDLVSTGGGASLALLAGETLPGLAVLQDR